MQFYTDSSSETLPRFYFLQRCSFTRASHQSTLHRCPSFQDVVLHELIIRQPYIGSLFQLTEITVQDFPRRVQFPQENWNSSPQAVSLSPVNSGSLSFTRHECVVWLDLKGLFPYQDITGLSSAKSQGKVVVNVVLSYPQRSLFTLPIQQQVSPTELLLTFSKASFFPQSIAFQHDR